MVRIWRIAVVVVLAVVASVAATAKLEGTHPVNTSACGRIGPNDPTYTLTTRTQPEPPRSPSSDVLAFVMRQGRPVTGANLCVAVDMLGMPMGMSRFQGREISPGAYDDPVTFGMGGTWAGTLVVSVGGRSVISRAVSYRIA